MFSGVCCAICEEPIPFFTPAYFYGEDGFICWMCNDKRRTSTQIDECYANKCEEVLDGDTDGNV